MCTDSPEQWTFAHVCTYLKAELLKGGRVILALSALSWVRWNVIAFTARGDLRMPETDGEVFVAMFLLTIFGFVIVLLYLWIMDKIKGQGDAPPRP